MACWKLTNDLQILRRNATKILTVAARLCYSKSDEIEKVTHTGQVFCEDDYRNVRFNNATRYVNDNWAINMIAEIPPIESTKRVVWCDGGDKHLGHPRVYINLDKPGTQVCGYCGLRYVKKHEIKKK